jgi:hypothetical protein
VALLEGAFWHGTGWQRIADWGLGHSEPLVRERAQKLSRERRLAELSNNYVERVLDSNDRLHDWRFGQALVAVGNEDALARLRHRMHDDRSRPYLEWLAKELEGQLEKRRQEDATATQLPPQLSQDQEVSLTIQVAGRRVGPFRGTLRESHVRRARSWTGSWAVWLSASPRDAGDLAFSTEAATVEIEDGRRGDVLVVGRSMRSTGARVQIRLLGNGPLA